MTSEARWVCPPTARTTAVCDVPPPAGMAPKNAPPRLDAPIANNSLLGRIGGSEEIAKARPAAAVSVKLISATPIAPGNSIMIRSRLGTVTVGSARGISPMMATPLSLRPNIHEAAMAPPTTASGAGE
ncbi:hypothetical protein D3C87_1658030 [compost metagenome]